MKPKKIFPGVYGIGRNIATENNTPGFRVYDERLIKAKGTEYREWDPFRSKLAAGILNGLTELPIGEQTRVLYLGASSGTTASHVSDITKEMVYCVESAKRMMRELLFVCERKKNMIPILGDAGIPSSFARNIGVVDVVYQDVAQRDQTEIFIKNMDYFKARAGLFAIKARSIDCIAPPKKVFKQEVAKLKERFQIIDVLKLEPYDKDHILVNVKR
ncbi:MAG: fibrillarin-like rRNA/tRNA 2'-O-methyltransferase [Candidatus Altiarchaeota archaeon]